MFFKTMGIACDMEDCDEETFTQGRDATMGAVRRQARAEGWSISEAGHFCPVHRRRQQKKGKQ